MKKLLYALLAISLIFSACEEEDAAPNTNNNNINSALSIGDTHQGGIIFYLDGNGGGLIAAPSDQADSTDYVPWGCQFGALIGTGTAIGTGAQNTIDIEAGCNDIGTAADICANLTLGGYSDWFLPSKDELIEMYLNIGQGNALGLGNIGGFANFDYWSSTEYNSEIAWDYNFNSGIQNQNAPCDKSCSLFVRATRAF
jgi:hypothetical protein